MQDVARVFELKESRLRYWAQTGFVNPSAKQDGRRVYTFCDLLEIRAAKGLLGAGIPLQRVRKNLQALRAALPEEPHPLLRIRCDGTTLHVEEAHGMYNPLSGQCLIDFGVEDLEQQIADVLQLSGRRSRESDHATNAEPFVATTNAPAMMTSELGAADSDSAYAWFLRGCAADERSDGEKEAIAAYERAIEMDGSLGAAYTNLGNLHHRLGDRAAAIRCYEQACSLDPSQPEGHYNLGNIYDEEGDTEMAISEYRRALRLSPEFFDAHFNLALALERVGSQVQAVDHWRRFIDLTSANREMTSWREIATRHLAQLKSPASRH